MTTLAVERLTDLMGEPKEWERFCELQVKHWEEVAAFKELLQLDPDYQRYRKLDQDKRLLLVIMRFAGDMVGYSLHIIVDHPHYKRVLVANDDIHYLMPHLRKAGEHRRLRSFAMAELKERGVQFVTARTKFGYAHDTSLRALGFEPFDSVYGCDLTKWKPPAEG